MATNIHPTAVIATGAELGVDVEIGPHTVVGPTVQIGDRTRIGAQVVIDGVTRIGEDNIISGQASLGGPPQDLSYRGESTRLEIGDRNKIREFITINRGTVKGGGTTSVGNDNLFMACCHVAHDCEIRNNVILGNNVLLAGHVLVEQHANIGGAAAAHHFVTIGAFAYVGGMTRMVQDVPPYVIIEGYAGRVRGINVIGLKRAQASETDIEALRVIFKRIYRTGSPRRKVLAELSREPHDPDVVQHLVRSLTNTEIGLKGRFRESMREEFARMGAERILARSAAP